MHNHSSSRQAHVSTFGSWCPEENTRDNVVARRNVLAGLWAGRLRGLSGPALTAYAVEVHMADFEVPGDADILAKIVSDLQLSGLPARPADVRARLNAFHREALAQTTSTD